MNKAYSNKALPAGTVLREWRIEEVLGVGGFGIVYKAKGIYFNELVAIKEYFPSSISERNSEETNVNDVSYRGDLESRLYEAAEQREKAEDRGASRIEHSQNSMLEKTAYADREGGGKGEPEREIDRQASQQREQDEGSKANKKVQNIAPARLGERGRAQRAASARHLNARAPQASLPP